MSIHKAHNLIFPRNSTQNSMHLKGSDLHCAGAIEGQGGLGLGFSLQDLRIPGSPLVFHDKIMNLDNLFYVSHSIINAISSPRRIAGHVRQRSEDTGPLPSLKVFSIRRGFYTG